MSTIKWHGEEYTSYAPGHGAIEFRHLSKGTHTVAPVPMEVIRRLTPPGWVLTDHNGIWEAYRPVRRIGTSLLEMSFNDETPTSYFIRLSETGDVLEFAIETKENEWESTRNESRIASLKWWLANEMLLPPSGTENEG